MALTRLNFNYTTINGRLGDYFILPNLRFLYLYSVTFLSTTSDNPSSAQNTRTFSDEIFFRNCPKLAVISLCYMSLDSSFIERLWLSQNFTRLVLYECKIDTFILPLLGFLEDSDPLPYLKYLRIDDSWSPFLNMSFEEFRQHVHGKLRDVTILGNGKRRKSGFW